jgi:hypothetical protein
MKHEIRREASEVAPDLLVEALGGHAVEHGEVRVEHDAPAAQHDDAPIDVLEPCKRHRRGAYGVARHRFFSSAVHPLGAVNG